MNKFTNRFTLMQLAIVLAALTGWIIYNDLAYGDWTCAFKRCVAVENIRP